MRDLLAFEADASGVAYHDLLTLWKYTDADIPIFRAAKVEYAELQ